ncbi:MAG: ABC transporter permease [Planctomycetota bacterium]
MGDLIRLGTHAVLAHRLRSLLSMLGIGIGIASVMLLTSIGEGTRRYVLAQFSQFGTNILAINPGKEETLGMPGMLGGTTHKLTLADAEALRRLPGVLEVVPVCFGMARVSARGLGRSVYVYGVTASMPAVWKMNVRLGSFLPPGDWMRRADVAVLGPRLKDELFGDDNALGEFVRIGGARMRVIGIMEPKGQFLGIDLDDTVYTPVATGMQIFNQDELMEIDVTYAHEDLADPVVASIKEVLTDRHGGREDYTITTQEAMLEVFGNVMDIVTLAVGAIGAISLLVGAIGILTMMWIAVGERTSEIGLLRAVGATARQVLGLFLAEAVLLAAAGGALGVLGGFSTAWLLRTLVAGLPLRIPPEFVLAALGVSAATGLVAGVLPARRAARLDPVVALRAE